jgi:protein TonB
MLDLRQPPPPPKPPSPAPKTIKVRPASKAAAAPPAHVQQVRPPKTPPVPWNVIPMTSAQFAASDISKMAAHGTAGKAAGAAAEGNGEAGDGKGKGTGGGDEIYDVDWYVKPARGVMESYMSRVTAKSGWGEVKCRMIDHYHVEDCAELDESPPGSGFSRALREAAWQFLVRPPRVNGKPLLGTWVRIHFDFNPAPGDGGGDAGAGG